MVPRSGSHSIDNTQKQAEVWKWGADQLIFGCIHLRGLTDCDTDVSEESQKVNDL